MAIWRLWASSYAFDSLLNKTVSSACINFFVLDQLNLRILSEEIIELQQLTCSEKEKKKLLSWEGVAVWRAFGPHFISAFVTSSSRICQHRRAKIYEPRIYGFLHRCKTSSCLFQAWKGNMERALVKLFLRWLRLITQGPEMKAGSLTEMSCTQSGREICVVMPAWFLSLLQNSIVGLHWWVMEWRALPPHSSRVSNLRSGCCPCGPSVYVLLRPCGFPLNFQKYDELT